MQGSDNLDALLRSVWLALGTATITTLVAQPIAFIIRRTNLPGRKLLSLFTLVTIAVPGIILACGYIFAWNAPWLEYIRAPRSSRHRRGCAGASPGAVN
jgi:iron(III) transport system permease protein